MDRFIVGTGRCGSTLLSRMLGDHPQVLSLFEFFTGLDWSRRFSSESITGAEFAELVGAEQPFVTAVLRRGYEVAEVTYPFDRIGSRRRSDPLPWPLVSMLPRLSSDPDALFAAMLAYLSQRPSAAPVDHYRSLFEWLAADTGRPHWIERSGSSIDYVADLARLFPHARFVHLHRDGPETALSMREHHAYRLPISLLYDVPLEDGTRVSQLGRFDVRAQPRDDDVVTRILRSKPPAEYFGRYWNDQVCSGLDTVATLAPRRYMEVRFEDVIANPHEQLARISEFFELDRSVGDWSERAAALVQAAPPLRVVSLPAAEREALLRSCQGGMRALGR